MRTLITAGLFVVVLSCFSYAKNTFHSFTLGAAVPLSSTSAMTIPDAADSNPKSLGSGWEFGWTFFGKPFQEKEGILSGLAFGGKVSYSRWVRDSTYTPVTFLGIQALSRYYLSLDLPFNLFAQAGGGLFIGEYAFSDPDTIDGTLPPGTDQIKITEGKKSFGMNAGFGFNWDVIEIVPLVTIVFTDKLSAWFSINAGMVF